MNKEHHQKYLDKSGDEKVFTSNLVENEHGFLSYAIDGDTVNIMNVLSVSGSKNYWQDHINDIAKENLCTKIAFVTRRNPKAWERGYGYKVVGHILEKEI